MINLNKEECCGCGVCYVACPRQCITMKEDNEGFVYPYIDKNLCVNCHICEKCCPSLNVISNTSNKKCYVAVNNSDERMSSSSGGIFVLLAKKIIESGGVVVGAAFDENWLVHHILCDNNDNLIKLMGSKYLQSRNFEAYAATRRLLEENRKVLYTGTACQIAGLKGYLKKEYDNLLTVDVLCHGVPSPGVWKRYLSELKHLYGDEITSISFRDKSTGWNQYSMTVVFENGETYTKKHSNDTFMNLFLSNSILRPSCHVCKYKSLDRPSDMTIGDAWGVEDIFTEFNDNKGSSVIIVHSEPGQELYNSISSFVYQKSTEIDRILPETADSRKSVGMPRGRALGFLYYRLGRKTDTIIKATYSRKITHRILRKIIKNKY
ncbi:Coenzyme F420 hydrogenase/dehydrogenase, beta subunit C-terminal domain [Butyrivibrio sp. INlla16]|uniref:Coenzyme F420 hydrogenase/dehydrogenase, beta subunit C-terminal domain n=1 Tax=Butyrivibrio sp. INlla16 TaxID=1520807 RepID=UPI00087F68F2|nr:Coenzyme F420 hydrogenase/dehydrogenase, beta subunit C-terminal domain [Butyrivibrio sp. INlla16]SDB01964.1 Coenzyme F420-reducing hydrogenase, beta subunit [Butyrivibrio sp. INlla16]